MKSIFNFDSTKDYLRHHIESLPKKGWGEIQRWSEHLEVNPSYLSQVLSGAKLLNADQAMRLSPLLGLQNIELDYFIALIEKEKSGHHATIKYYETRLANLKRDSKSLAKQMPRDKVLTAEQKSIFYSSWIYSATRMLCSLPQGQTLQEILERLDLPKEEVYPVLNFLCETGLCEKKGSHYHVGVLKTHIEKNSPHARKHWTNWHLKAIQRFDTVAEDEMIYSAPFTVSEKDFDLLREDLVAFLKNFASKIEKTKPEKVALLNIDFLKIL